MKWNGKEWKEIVGSRFSDRAHYNEFVESRAKSWALIRRRFVLGMKDTQNRAAQRPREKDPSLEDENAPTPLDHARASPLFLGLCCYLSLSYVHPPPTLVSYPCLSSSARPLSHSFWCSMSCCGPHRLVQGSHPHQIGVRVLVVCI